MPDRSASASEVAVPTGRLSRRLVGIDVARAVALVGMIATHTLAERNDTGSLSLSHTIASGRASALFAVLAGVSLALLSGRTEPVVGAERTRRSTSLAVRAVLIASIGLTLGLLDSGLAVILTYYGLLFLVALPFLGLRARALFVLAGTWIVAAPVLSQVVRAQLPERGFESPSWGQLADPAQLLGELAFTGYYPVVPWLAYVLLGLGIGRLRLDQRSVQATLALVGSGAAVLSIQVSRVFTARDDVRRTLASDFGVQPDQVLDQISGGLFGVTPEGSWSWLLVAAPHSATPFDLAQTGGSALAVIGVCLLLVGALPAVAERATAIVFGAGTMTLTLYSLHVFLRTEAIWPPDEGPDGFRAHALVVLVIGAVFVALGRRGPLEAVVGLCADTVSGRDRAHGRTPRSAPDRAD